MLGTVNQEARKPRFFLSVKDGSLFCKIMDEEKRFSYVDAKLENIYQKERVFNNGKTLLWYMDLMDSEGKERYTITFPYGSNLFKSLILSLSSDETLNRESIIRIQPYTKNGYEKVVVYSNGVKLDWVTKDLPPIKTTTVGNRTIKDDSERMELISSLVQKLVNNITSNKII